MTISPENSVTEGMVRCLSRLQGGSWVSSLDIFGKLESLSLGSHTQNEERELFECVADYAAASAFLHCTDGWSYLGRAANALANGLLDEATHFAYYSEIRSAIAILACSGTVIHNNHSFVLSNGDSITKNGGGTHNLVWNLLEDWTFGKEATEMVGSIISVNGSSLTDWLNTRGLRGNTPSTISGLLQVWGVDLRKVRGDKVQRNIASYQPGRLENSQPPLTSGQICELLLELSSLLQPLSACTFPNIDMHLLGQALRLGGKFFTDPPGVTEHTGSEPSTQELERLTSDVLGVGFGEVELASRLKNVIEEDSLIRAATEDPTSSYPTAAKDILGMIGRALILARIATGNVDRIRDAAGFDNSTMAPWADTLGVSLGYWDPASRPESLIDLWEDMAIAIESLQENVILDSRLNSIHKKSPWEVLVLTSLTRTALWSLSA